MFRNVRKKGNARSEEEARQLLRTVRRGILAVNGDDGYPYAIPINFYYDEAENRLCFHGSHAGHKTDALKRDDRVCFTVYGEEIIRDEDWAPYVVSAVLFGRCRPITAPEEAERCLRRFALKYYPSQALVEEEIAATGRAVKMYEITIEHLTAKEVQER